MSAGGRSANYPQYNPMAHFQPIGMFPSCELCISNASDVYNYITTCRMYIGLAVYRDHLLGSPYQGSLSFYTPL